MNIKGFFSNWIVRNLLLAALAVLLFVLAANLFLSLVTLHLAFVLQQGRQGDHRA